MLLGVICGMAAALCYGVASVVQSVAVGHLTAVPTREKWSTRIWAGRWYAAGLALDGAGFLASVVALRTLPLFLVQALVAASIGVTALLAAIVFGTGLGRRQIVALVVLAAGLVALVGSAPEQVSRGITGVGPWLLLVGVVPLVLVMGFSVRGRPRWGFAALAVCAGLGFAGVGISARVLTVPASWWHLVSEPAAWALAAYGLQSVVCFGMALAKGSVTVATALSLGVETVVPGVIGLTILGDHVRQGFGILAIAGFVAAVGGCLVLAARAPVDKAAEQPR